VATDQWDCFISDTYTVEPLITDSLLSGQPLLSGQLAWNRLLSMGLLILSHLLKQTPLYSGQRTDRQHTVQLPNLTPPLKAD